MSRKIDVYRFNLGEGGRSSALPRGKKKMWPDRGKIKGDTRGGGETLSYRWKARMGDGGKEAGTYIERGGGLVNERKKITET